MGRGTWRDSIARKVLARYEGDGKSHRREKRSWKTGLKGAKAAALGAGGTRFGL